MCLETHSYGDAGPAVVVLHGGPGAPGHMAPVAEGLADAFRVIEPWQRNAGDEPLTVAHHVQDLHAVVERDCAGERPALVGSSWGAMLALAYAATHPDRAGPLVLIGCGTFDERARAQFRAAIDQRIDAGLRDRLDRAASVGEVGELLFPVFCHDPVVPRLEGGPVDDRAHDETWNDMLRLQKDGTYPAAFAAIETPVLMLHGAHDPHPGPAVRDSLKPFLKDLAYLEWEECGHYPWIERAVRDDFFAVLRAWLRAT